MTTPPAPGHLRFATYNLLDYGWADTLEESRRRDRCHDVINALSVDALAVQEIRSTGENRSARATELVREIGEATGLTAELPGGGVSLALGDHTFHTAILRRPDLEVESWTSWGGESLFHSAGRLVLVVDGKQVAHFTYHGRPFGQNARADEAEYIKSRMTRPDGRPPALCGADWNCVSADRAKCSTAGDLGYYDPDPYVDQPWHPDFVHQCEWTYDQRGQRNWWANRRPGEILSAGGLIDVAAALEVPWQPTTGHWPANEPYGPRRIDAIKATEDMIGAIQHYGVETSDLARSASDHLPPFCDYAPALLSQSVNAV